MTELDIVTTIFYIIPRAIILGFFYVVIFTVIKGRKFIG